WRDTLQPAPIYTGAPPYMAPRLRCGRPAQSQAARQRLIRVKTTPYDLISSRRQRCGAALYLATCGRGPYDGIRHGFKRLSPMTVNTALATAPPSHLEQRCIESGMKMTGQRRIIARVLSDSLDHPDVEEVHRRASAEDSRISIATVYRTMRLFEEAGIVQRHEFGDRRARYEEVPGT